MIETNIQNASNAEKDVNAASDRALATASNDFERIKKLVGDLTTLQEAERVLNKIT